MEIKKCPCCGGEAQLLKEDLAGYRVKCIGYRCNIMTPLCFTEDTAVEIWNSRYVEQPQNERVKYALKRLEESGFEVRCMNDKQGLIHCYDRDGELVCYYDTTGTIQGSDKKGILRLLDRLRGYNG
jgi:hypothetical protein